MPPPYQISRAQALLSQAVPFYGAGNGHLGGGSPRPSPVVGHCPASKRTAVEEGETPVTPTVPEESTHSGWAVWDEWAALQGRGGPLTQLQTTGGNLQ